MWCVYIFLSVGRESEGNEQDKLKKVCTQLLVDKSKLRSGEVVDRNNIIYYSLDSINVTENNY